jgi:hypothetical protein
MLFRGHTVTHKPQPLHRSVSIIILLAIFISAACSKANQDEKNSNPEPVVHSAHLTNGWYPQDEIALNNELSFYSEIMEMLLGSRKEYKKKMFEAVNLKDKSQEDLYDTRQLVYKTLSNAVYGVFGNKVFRFFNVDCARSITLSGQEAIKNVMINAENFVESKKTNHSFNFRNIKRRGFIY